MGEMTLFGTGSFSGDSAFARHYRNLLQYLHLLTAANSTHETVEREAPQVTKPIQLPSFTCPCCTGNSYSVRVRHGSGCHLIRCGTCEAEMFWPIPSADELTSYYTTRNVYTDIGDSDVSRYLADPSPTRKWAAYLDQKFKSFGVAAGARMLELGCMHGLVSIEMRRLGYDAWGIELSQDGIKFCNE